MSGCFTFGARGLVLQRNNKDALTTLSALRN
jgi:hypothetical protein